MIGRNLKKGSGMVKVAAAVAMIVMVWAQAVWAQQMDNLVEQSIRRDPSGFELRMLDLVAGFGGVTGLDAQDIEDHIALERARARATAMRRFLAMDLDTDGQISLSELATVQRAASAATRGRLARQFAAVDADGDGVLNPDEQMSDAEAAALRALDQAEADLLRAPVSLDGNGDGAVSAQELRASVARVSDAG